MFSIKFSPETLIMVPFALMIDIVGIIILCCGLDDCGVLDIVWIIFSTPWLILRGNKSPSKKSGIWGWFQGVFTGKWSRYLTPDLGGLVPYVGNIIPFRTISVLFNLQD
jgi:hypothetical protein